MNPKTETKLILSVNGTELTASLADSIAAQELTEKLKAEPVTVTLNEYGGFEKVGKLPWSLTKNDEPVITEVMFCVHFRKVKTRRQNHQFVFVMVELNRSK